MNIYFIPPVQNMAAARIALCIYYSKDIEKMLEIVRKIPRGNKYGCDRDILEFWKLIEAKAAEKLPSLPGSLKARVSKFLRPIHSETIRWFREHKILEKDCGPVDCDPFLTYKNELCWKNDGSIDRAQTAKKFAQNKNFDPEMRFVMACTYFLEDEVLALWHGEKVSNIKSVCRYRTNTAVRFWVKRLKRGYCRKMPWKAEIAGYFKNSRVQALDIPLRISCFFPYLSWEGKKKCLSLLRSFKGHIDDFVLCLRAMDEGERMEMVSVCPKIIIFCFLIWPFQCLFIDVAKQLWGRMNFNLFKETLDWFVIKAISEGPEDFDYAEILKEFWHLGPASYKIKIKKNKKLFEMIEITLNYDGKNALLSLPETLEESLEVHLR